MITGPDLTPEQREKSLHSQRSVSTWYAIFGVIQLGLVAFELSRGRSGAYVYISLALGVGWLFIAWFNWSRAKKRLA